MLAFAAVACFVLATFGIATLGPVTLVPLGLAFFVLYQLWPWGPSFGPRRND